MQEISDEKADLFIEKGLVLNVYSGELIPHNIAVSGERIFYTGPRRPGVGPETRILRADDRVVVPGYIDPHFHPWMIYNPVTFGEAACSRGITTLFCDNLLFYLLMGVDRFEAMMAALWRAPIKYFWFCRAVPQTPMKDEEALFSVSNLERLLRNPLVQSLGEITRWPDLLKKNHKIRSMIRSAREFKKRVDGHTAGARYDRLAALAWMGVDSCHESIRGQEALDKLRLGFSVMLRESSLRQDLRRLLKAIKEAGVLTDRVMLTTDSSSPSFYDAVGINERLITIALEEGIEPVEAYRMCTLNPACYFGMDHEIGGIAPGRFADILILRDLYRPLPETVISKGRVVAEKGRLLSPFPEVPWRSLFSPSHLEEEGWHAEPDWFAISGKGPSVRFPVIDLVKPVITRTAWMDLPVKAGRVELGRRNGLSWISVLDRHGSWVSNGVLRGFAGSLDGFASSFNTAVQILAMGRKREALAAAVNRVRRINGGIVAVQDGVVQFELPLPLGGVMSDQSMKTLAEKDRELLRFLSSHGYPFHDPLYTLVFLPNDFLPDTRINYQGVVDIKTGEVLWPRRDL